MDSGGFIFAPEPYVRNGAFFVRIPGGIKGIDNLFSAYESELKLPSYFGRNWNAFYECLITLDWVAEREIIITHVDVPQMREDDLKIYLSVLRDAAGDWKSTDEHFLTILFPPIHSATVLQYLTIATI